MAAPGETTCQRLAVPSALVVPRTGRSALRPPVIAAEEARTVAADDARGIGSPEQSGRRPPPAAPVAVRRDSGLPVAGALLPPGEYAVE